ncbi:MAG: LacI family DNA-binding transcriptional regulator [Clostridiales bacterium]|nr:LacI family DNA-binding transcriptional regulator [Clostridiales bacterium]
MISIRKVASLAGVSPATVSRVINGTANVNPEKKAKVMQVIEETGFIPNEAARTLFRKSAKTIGLIVPSIRNPYFTELAAHVDATATKYSYRPFLCNTNYDPEKEKAAIHMLVGMNADAIIVASCSEQIRDIIDNCPIPVVAIDAMLSDASVEACIYCDYYQGGRMAAQHLINNGCRSIVCIKGPQHRYSARERYGGYRDICREQNIPEQTVDCDYDFNQGILMTQELLKRFPDVDGIIACNDIVAISTYKVLHNQNISVPEKVQLVGFDDISFSALLSPELTTISQPIQEMAEKAVELIANCELTRKAGEKYVLPVSLVVRQTTQKRE